MKARDWIFLFAVITVGVTIGNLIALKIVSDKVSGQLTNSPWASLLSFK